MYHTSHCLRCSKGEILYTPCLHSEGHSDRNPSRADNLHGVERRDMTLSVRACVRACVRARALRECVAPLVGALVVGALVVGAKQ